MKRSNELRIFTFRFPAIFANPKVPRQEGKVREPGRLTPATQFHFTGYHTCPYMLSPFPGRGGIELIKDAPRAYRGTPTGGKQKNTQFQSYRGAEIWGG